MSVPAAQKHASAEAPEVVAVQAGPPQRPQGTVHFLVSGLSCLIRSLVFHRPGAPGTVRCSKLWTDRPCGPRVQPIAPEIPPDPRFPPLTSGQQQNFHTWLNSLREGDVSGGRPAEVAYQKRVAGYPEYEVPIPPGISAGNTLMVDGFRDSDGMAIEAKYVNKPNQKCYRSLDELRQNHESGKKDFLYYKDRQELEKYSAALKDPRNTEMRGVETVTNNQDSVQYWRIMMAAYGVKGHARYVP